VPRRLALGFAVLVAVFVCQIATPAQDAQSADAKAGDKEPKPVFSQQDRLQLLRQASIFTPKTISESDIMVGPEQEAHQFHLHFNDKVSCEFALAGEKKNGNTPKFDCRITRVVSADGKVQVLTDDMKEEPVKVKFHTDNREIYAEVAATRLFWALGFYADSMFPVRLECLNCPPDPQTASGPKGTRLFNEAVIERKFPGHKVYVGKDEDAGWSWKEFETVDKPTYQKDGLKLLAAFIIHSDNKPQQQRLVCNGAKVDTSTQPPTTKCRESRMLVQDLGATFGGGGKTTNKETAKRNLKEWSGKKVWKSVGSGQPGTVDCQAELPKSMAAKDGLDSPRISEEGRRFAAGLLCQLSDPQIQSLFTVARVAEMPDSKKAGESVVNQWVEVFKKKREEVAAGRCKWKAEPADLKEIDNPMGLSTVPNSCTAHPF
jgi:hypothetical protein